MGSSFVWDYKIKWDNSANKFFDTLAAGKPMLINHMGWQADLIKEKNCGYVLPAHIKEKDCWDFVQYINDMELMKMQGVNSLNLAKSEFSLEIASKKYLSILKAI
jgi:hypothetical protein